MTAFASTQARKLAADFGLEPASIAGSGRDGRVTLADVRSHAPPEPPEELGEAGARLWRDVRRDWRLRPDEDRLLLAACRTMDELGRMEAALAAADPVVAGSKGQTRAHPLIAEVRAHRLALKALLAGLGIEDAVGGEELGAARSDAGRKLAQQRWAGRG